ncbi:hypothetical protein NW767_015662 [Fusarium falciforme]|nr:hypothetical protein NW767_015662 [Fusarium falciforme]
MPLALFPGIRYDALEPPPPGRDPGHIDAHYMHGDHNGWEPPDALPHWRLRGRVNAPRRRRWGVGGAAEVGNHDQEPHEEGFLPPLSTSVKAQIIHDTAKFTVTQVFENQSHGIKQGVYQFPLPLDATVTGFDCRIGPNKIVRGKVKARKDARYEFDEARRQGRTGGLMEQQTAEIFTITLANIPSQTKMQAELSFMCLLKHRVEADHQVFTLTLPTFIAPRYGDAPPGIRMSTRDSHFLSLGVDVLTAEDLLSVESETHAIRYTMGAGPRPCQTWDEFIAGHDNDAASPRAATVELEHRLTSLDKDLVITINTALSDNAEAPQACLETHPKLGNHQALMLTLPPELMTAGVNSPNDGGEIIFLADRSGSMVDKIDSLKSAMMFFISGIPENQPFNIWCFGSQYTCLWPQSRRLDEASQQEAIAYVRNEFASDMGGTAILPALEEICNTMGDYPTMDVIVLTDGQVWSAPETIGFVRSRRVISRGAARFFSLGIGGAVSHELVEGIAKAGGGYAEVITSASGGGWEDRVVAVLKAATTSHIGRLCLRLEWEEQDNLGPPSNFKQSPVDVSNLSPFLRNRIFLLFDSGEQYPELKHVVLQVQSPSGSIINKTILPKRLCQPDTLIHKLAARALLGDLERGESWLGAGRGSGTDDPQIRAEAIDLGCKWSLVSRWTSVYAVEEETAAPNEGMVMEMEIHEAADELNDALLLRRGGRAAANLRARLTRPEAAAEESGSESDNSESSLDTRSAGQSATGNNSDGDSDDDTNNPGFDSNTGQDTDPGSGNESPSYGRADQPGERQAPPDMPQGQSGSTEALQPGGEHHSHVMRNSHGWNPTPRPEYAASSGEEVHSLSGFRRVRDSNHPTPTTGRKIQNRRRRLLDDSDEQYCKRSRPLVARRPRLSAGPEPPGPEPPGDRTSVPPSDHTLPTAHGSVQQAPTYTYPGLFSSDMPQVALYPASHTHSAESSNGQEPLQGTSLSSSSDMPGSSGLHTNLETGTGLSGLTSPSIYFHHWTPPAQSDYSASTTSDLLGYSTMDAQAGAQNAGSSMLSAPVSSGLYQPACPPPPPPLGSYRPAPPISSASYRRACPPPPPPPVSSASYRQAGSMSSPLRRPRAVHTYAVHTYSGSEIYHPHREVSEPSSFAYKSTSAATSAPIFNPPASTSLVHNVRPAAKTPDELAAEQFIYRLVHVQLSDGRFSFSDDDSVKTTLGLPFLRLVTSLRSKLISIDPAVTIAIVALLEEQFQSCRDLWVLMVRKAADYITGCNLGSIVEELQQEARQGVKSMSSVMKEVRDGEAATEAVTELENAPIF